MLPARSSSLFAGMTLSLALLTGCTVEESPPESTPTPAPSNSAQPASEVKSAEPGGGKLEKTQLVSTEEPKKEEPKKEEPK